MDTIINKKTGSGFTLIELSIVLVIIGLIIGGILTGQELIHGAGVRANMAQIIKYNTAVNTFYMKFNALPGDFSSASSYIAGTTVGGNGDGNGLIGTVAGPSTPGGATAAGVAMTASVEYGNFWNHLYLLGLVDGSYANITAAATALAIITNFPPTKSSSGAGILAYGNTGDNVNYYNLGMASVTAGGVPTTNNFLSPSDALNFDTKMDDGNPLTGIVAARGYVVSVFEAQPTVTGNAALSASSTGSCLYGTTYAAAAGYNTAAPTSSALCQLRVRVN